MVNIARFSAEARAALGRAKAIASERAGKPASPSALSLVQALLNQDAAAAALLARVTEGNNGLLAAISATLVPAPGAPPETEVRVEPETIRLLERAEQLARETPVDADETVDALHLWCAVFEAGVDQSTAWVTERGLHSRDLYFAGKRALQAHAHALSLPLPAADRSILERFADDFTAFARQGRLRPAIGRQQIFERLCEQLIRLGKRNVVLTGEGGVGKTFLVRHLAWALVHEPQAVPAPLRSCQVYALDQLRLRMGAGVVGELEGRVREFTGVLERHGERIILFIDEMHTLVGGSLVGGRSGLDLANALKPLLAEGVIRCIGATTPREYNEYIAPDQALARRFAEVRVPALDNKSTLELLRFESPRFEQHIARPIEDAALREVVDLAGRYMPNRQFPDKAVDLLDAVCANVLHRDERAVTVTDVRRVLMRDLDLPRLDDAELTSAEIERVLSESVVGQHTACHAIALAIVHGFRLPPEHVTPRCVLFFSGPSRVGKTLAAQTIAGLLCARREQVLRIDMNEYAGSESGHVVEALRHRLLGPPPPYEGASRGGILTNHLLTYPAAVILLDEFEKAAPGVQDLFLGIFDHGEALDGLGRIVSFRDCYFIMTSNVVADEQALKQATPETLRRVLNAYGLRREFVNRISTIIQFSLLDRAALTELARRAWRALQSEWLQRSAIRVVAQPNEDAVATCLADIALTAMALPRHEDIGFGVHRSPHKTLAADVQVLNDAIGRALQLPLEAELQRLEVERAPLDRFEVRVESGDRLVIEAHVLQTRVLLVDAPDMQVAVLSRLDYELTWETSTVDAVAHASLLAEDAGEAVIVVLPAANTALREALEAYADTGRAIAVAELQPPEAWDGLAAQVESGAAWFWEAVDAARKQAQTNRLRHQLRALIARFQEEQERQKAAEAAAAPIRLEGGLVPLDPPRSGAR